MLASPIIEIKNLSAGYDNRTVLHDVNLTIYERDFLGIIGPNGAGKTTLFRLIMGLEKADKGEFEVGETVKVAYVDQQHKDIDPN